MTVGILRDGHLAADRSECEARVPAAEAVYKATGLVRHEGKEVRGAESAIVWGCSLDGPRRAALTDPEKLSQAIAITVPTILENRCRG